MALPEGVGGPGGGMLRLGCIEEKGASSSPLEPDLWVLGEDLEDYG